MYISLPARDFSMWQPTPQTTWCMASLVGTFCRSVVISEQSSTGSAYWRWTLNTCQSKLIAYWPILTVMVNATGSQALGQCYKVFVCRGYMLSNMCDSERPRMIFILGDHERNLDKFSVLAITESLSDSAVTVFLCSWHLFEYNWSKFVVGWSAWTTSRDCLLLNISVLQTSVHVVYHSPINQNRKEVIRSSRSIYLIFLKDQPWQ